VGFASQGPVFLLAQVGGAVADRHDRRRILVATQAAAMVLAATLAALTLTGAVRVWEVFGLAALLGTVNAFDVPTRQAFVVEMVGRDHLQNAIALNSSMFNVARLLGPAVAGLTVAAVGEGWCFLANAVSFVAVIAGLLAMRLPPFTPQPDGAPIFARVRAGLGHVAASRPIRTLLLLVGLMSLVGMPYAVLMPIFAARILGGGPERLGALMSAAGLGALAAALVLASRKGLAGLGTVIAQAVIGFGVALIGFSASRWFPLSLALLVVVGFCQMTHMAAANTLVQSMVPDAYRGRVMATYSMMFLGMAPFGALLAGLAAGAIGAPATVAVGGGVCIAGGLLFARALPSLRGDARRLVEANRKGPM
jgi:MFS family permease